MPSEFQAIYNAQLKQVDGQVMMTLKKEQDNLYSYEMITRPSGFWRIIIDGSIWEKAPSASKMEWFGPKLMN